MNARPPGAREPRAPILVSGTPGTVGSELVRLLHEAGWPVRALVRRPESVALLRDLGAETVCGDLREPETLLPALAGVERVFVNSRVGPAIEAQANLIAVATKAGVSGLVKLSWIGVAEEFAPLRFARSHAAMERELRTCGVRAAILRASSFMQNYLSLLTNPSGTTVYGASAEGRESYVDARDVAAAAASLLTKPTPADGVYEVTGPEALSDADLAAIIGRVTGRAMQAMSVHPDELADNYRRLGCSDAWVEERAALQELRATDRLATVTDVVERLTGRTPRSFAAFVRESAAM